MSNTLWRIAFGDYDLSVDRRTLTYHLTETKTGTVWADGLSFGWMEVEERTTGTVTRHDFGEMRVVSVSEKSAATGKRILFGLDCDGIPVDVYVIAGLREVQIIVEANRDSASHRVHGFGLLPDLCSVLDDERSYLVEATDIGNLNRSEEDGVGSQRFWGDYEANMPFLGAVRQGNEPNGQRVALALITDSVYGSYNIYHRGDVFTSELRFGRDPERRRIDVRILPIPHGDHISVARAYRDKIIGEGNHITLRRKIRERPALERLLGAPWFHVPVDYIHKASAFARDLAAVADVPCAVWAFSSVPSRGGRSHEQQIESPPDIEEIARELTSAGHFVIQSDYVGEFKWRDPEAIGLNMRDIRPLSHRLQGESAEANLWEAMEAGMDEIRVASSRYEAVVTTDGNDWHNIGIVAIRGMHWGFDDYDELLPAPLYSSVYHDAVITPCRLQSYSDNWDFQHALLSLSPAEYDLNEVTLEDIRRTYAILGPLHRLTFTAFLTAHRYLAVEEGRAAEAFYSDKTWVVANRSDTELFWDDLHLPPGGFYVRHPQMEAHDALRVGDRTFETRAWRIRRSLDGKPLEESENILTQEFSVPPGE